VTVVSVPRSPRAVGIMRSRSPSEAQSQSLAMGELEHDRLAVISAMAERAGITGGLPELLRDPRLIAVLADHFRVPSPSADACAQYYRDHLDAFREPDRRLGRQIVLPLAGGDVTTQPEVWARAERIIAMLNFSPSMFPDLAASYGMGWNTSGQLGPVARGALAAPLDAMFFALRPGEICPVPIVTEQGVHVVILDRTLPGDPVSFSAAHGRVSARLRQEQRHAAAARHLARLAERYHAT
jgi:peptidyl-prolyl cis-trans isomerase C